MRNGYFTKAGVVCWWLVVLMAAAAGSAAARWEVADPGASDPNAVVFTDALHGVVSAAASSGFVFEHGWISPLRWTEDGGLTWKGAEAACATTLTTSTPTYSLKAVDALL